MILHHSVNVHHSEFIERSPDPYCSRSTVMIANLHVVFRIQDTIPPSKCQKKAVLAKMPVDLQKLFSSVNV